MEYIHPLAIGCDVGGTEIKTVILRGGRIVLKTRIPTPKGPTAAAVVRAIAAEVLRTLEAAAAGPPGKKGSSIARGRSSPSRDAVLGLALPGFLDRRRHGVVHLSNLPVLDGTPLRSMLHRRLRIPVVLEADSNAGALGEALRGAGRGARRVLYITLGTGVGTALIADGEIIRAAHHTIGQVAHLPLDPDPRGPPCPCGRRGCVESVLSARGILWRAARAEREGARMPAGSRTSIKALCDGAKKGKKGSAGARQVLREAGTLLGAASAFLANFLSPDRIVVGGGIAGAGDLLLESARSACAQRAHPRFRNVLEIIPASLGTFAGAVGAALLARRAIQGSPLD